MKKRNIIILIVSIILLLICFCLGVTLGRYNIRIDRFFKAVFTSDSSVNMERSIIMKLRLPRTLIAGLSGMSLAISGLLYQETFQNKLVSPDLLGVSNGAGVGAALAIVLGLSSFFISAFAFIIGVGTVIATSCIAKLFRNKSTIMLPLSGIIVSGLMSSILSLIKYFAHPETQLSDITYWLMGSFANTTMNEVLILFIVVLISSSFLIIFRFRINYLTLGEEEAISKGLNYKLYRSIVVIIATLLTALTVSFSGTISWIGLVIPHIVRIVCKRRNTMDTIPICLTFGGIFMIAVDILSRIFTTNEIPLSAVTGLFGTVIFIVLLIIGRRKLYDY